MTALTDCNNFYFNLALAKNSNRQMSYKNISYLVTHDSIS